MACIAQLSLALTRDAGPIVAAIIMTLPLADALTSPALALRSLLHPFEKDGCLGTLMHVGVGTLFTALPIAWGCYLALV